MSVLILGTFDGVHTAHRQLITEAKKTGKRIIACTFSSPFSGQRLLTTLNEKTDLLEKHGVQEVFVQNFKDIKDLEAEEYIRLLCEKFKPSYIVTGFNHRFGKNARGNPALLSVLGRKYSFIPITVPPVKENDVIVSSTYIRSLILEGKVDEAKRFLGRYYTVKGETVHGKHLGSTIDFPTINTRVTHKLIPQSGVYATLVKVFGKIYKGMTNIGTNPTVDGSELTVETHILGFSGDLYGKETEIFFIKKVRDDKKFASLEDLKAQLSDDALLINAYLDTIM